MKQELKATDYRHIAAWGQVLQSFQYYITDQQEKALRDNAPIDAVYFSHDGKWITFRDIENSRTKELVNSFLEKRYRD